MLFARLKTYHGLERMRLRGIAGARDEFLLAAIVQNLKTMGLHLLGPQQVSVRVDCISCVANPGMAVADQAARPAKKKPQTLSQQLSQSLQGIFDSIYPLLSMCRVINRRAAESKGALTHNGLDDRT